MYHTFAHYPIKDNIETFLKITIEYRLYIEYFIVFTNNFKPTQKLNKFYTYSLRFYTYITTAIP